MKLIPATKQDKEYFRALCEIVYRDLVETQFGSWDTNTEHQKFNKKWKEQEFQKIYLQDELIGGIWIQEFEDYFQLREIQIHPLFQNQGIGTTLLQQLIKRSIETKKEVRLRVLRQNPAIKLYLRLGFVIVDENKMQYHMLFCPN